MSNTVLALKFVIGLRDRDDGLVVILCVGLEVNIAITADMCPVFGTIFVRVVPKCGTICSPAGNVCQSRFSMLLGLVLGS